MWDKIDVVYSRWDVSWCIRGDFNVARFPSETSGETWLDPAMADFLFGVIGFSFGGGFYMV